MILRNKRCASIPDNLIALILFSLAFVYIVHSMSGYITPYLEREEYGSVRMTGYTALEKIICDPSYGVVENDHVLSYDNLVNFRTDPQKYEDLKKELGIPKKDFTIEVVSTLLYVDTIAIATPDEGFTLPKYDGVSYTLDDKPHYNLSEVKIGNEYYELLVVYKKPNPDEKDKVYARVYIDIDHDRNFQDEVDLGFYDYSNDENHSGFIEGDTFTILQAPTRMEKLKVVDVSAEGLSVTFLNSKAVDIWIGEPTMMRYIEGEVVPTGGGIIAVFTRLVLLDEGGNIKQKKIVFTMRE